MLINISGVFGNFFLWTHTGVVGRFKINPDYLKAKKKTEGKVKTSRESSEKNSGLTNKKKVAIKKPIIRRRKISDVNKEKLTSLKQTSAAAKVRNWIVVCPSVRPNVFDYLGTRFHTRVIKLGYSFGGNSRACQRQAVAYTCGICDTQKICYSELVSEKFCSSLTSSLSRQKRTNNKQQNSIGQICNSCNL